MSTWRGLAIELFPEHRQWIQDEGLTFSIYQLFFDLLPIAREAHQRQDKEMLERIYQYAEWCWKQQRRAPDIHNAVAVAFYEHLIDDRSSMRDIPFRIKPYIFGDVKSLFEEHLSPELYQELLADYNAANGTTFS